MNHIPHYTDDRLRNVYRTPEQMSHDEKLARALAYLGDRYALHPQSTATWTREPHVLEKRRA